MKVLGCDDGIFNHRFYIFVPQTAEKKTFVCRCLYSSCSILLFNRIEDESKRNDGSQLILGVYKTVWLSLYFVVRTKCSYDSPSLSYLVSFLLCFLSFFLNLFEIFGLQFSTCVTCSLRTRTRHFPTSFHKWGKFQIFPFNILCWLIRDIFLFFLPCLLINRLDSSVHVYSFPMFFHDKCTVDILLDDDGCTDICVDCFPPSFRWIFLKLRS